MTIAPLLLAAALSATPDDPSTRDGFFTEAAAVARAGSVVLSTGGGSSVAQDGGSVGAVAGARAVWAAGRSLAAGVELSHDGNAFSPAVTLRWQFLSQLDTAINAAALVRYKSIGFRGTGSEVEAELMAGRAYDRLALSAAGVIGKGFEGESAVDLEGKAAASWMFTETLRAGVETRVRAEVALGAETVKPPGREYDLVAGPTVAWRLGAVELQAIAGLGVPRGTAAPGPMALALLSFDM